MGRKAYALSGVIILGMVFLMSGMALAINPNAPASLKTVFFELPPDLNAYISDINSAIRLGKALFWDMQIGSDGVQACASCHFHAGADSRVKNQVNPGFLHGVSGIPYPTSATFELTGPNSLLLPSHFPLHQRDEPADFQASPVIFDTDDVISSQGVFNTQFVDIVPGSAVDVCNSVPDPVFNVLGLNTRRVPPRNTPPVINAIFNRVNFWDGRASLFFNGVNPFGPADVNARVLINDPISGLRTTKIAIANSALASQAVGPPLNDVEMSCAGRSFPKLGKKMLSLTPLGKQIVHPQDSVLGFLSRALIDSRGRAVGTPGLSTTYADMIRAAFQPRWWNSNRIITFPNGVMTIGNAGIPLTTNEFTQMEANFSLIFGLAIQLYESTLVSDDSPFDRFQIGINSAMTPQQQRGLDMFLGQGRCILCHDGSLFSDAAAAPPPPENVPEVEIMPMIAGQAFYDIGFHNISVTVNTASQVLSNADIITIESYDIARGGSDPFGNPLSFTRLGFELRAGLLDPEYAPFVQDLPCVVPCPDERANVDGTFKTPILRNVELTGPYFHNGSAGTLPQLIDFYVRGGNFPTENILSHDPDVREIGFMRGDDLKHADLEAFLKSLTDERVRNESGPFDHPQLFIPNGHPGDGNILTCVNGPQACDDLLEIPAVGVSGRLAAQLPLIQPFLAQSVGAGGDFNGDGTTDIVWRHAGTGQNAVWLMDGTVFSSGATIPTVADTNWKIVGTGDFNGDGQTDIVWRNTANGFNAVWMMNGTTFVSGAEVLGVSDVNWEIVEVRDMNADNQPDILWRHAVTGDNTLFLMNGTAVGSLQALPPMADVSWKIAGAADFNVDGQTDILWRNVSNGQNVVWFMNGIALTGATFLPTVSDVSWKIVGTRDFNGDGRADILWRNTASGQNVLWLMNGMVFTGSVSLGTVADPAWEIVGP